MEFRRRIAIIPESPGSTSACRSVPTPAAGWSTWVGIAISVRSSDVRVAQQISLLANLPLILAASLIAFDTIHPTPALAIGITSVLLIADALGWRIVAPMFDRERLIVGTG